MEEKNEIIKSNKAYGKIVCRCEKITEGEIVRAITVNPQATDEQLVQFAQMLEALTTNKYAGTTKITEEAIG